MSTEKGNTEVDSGREKAAQAVFTPSQASHGFTNQVQGWYNLQKPIFCSEMSIKMGTEMLA